MPRIVIFSETVTPSTLLEVNGILGCGLNELRSRIQDGVPILDIELLDNNYQEHAEVLRRLMHANGSKGVISKIYQLPEEESYELCDDKSRWEIDAVLLTNLLESIDED